MRPGTLLLGLMINLAIGLLLWKNNQKWPRGEKACSLHKRLFIALSILILIGYGLPNAIQKLSLAGLSQYDINTRTNSVKCGGIASHSGLSAYGVSVNKDWTHGQKFINNYINALSPDESTNFYYYNDDGVRIGQCESTLNGILYAKAFNNFIEAPHKVILRIGKNAEYLAKQALHAHPSSIWVSDTLFSVRALSYIGVIMLFLVQKLRRLCSREFKTKEPLGIIFWYAAIGLISMQLFQLFFLHDAYFRPVTAYSIFPVLMLGLLVEIYLKVVNNTLQPSLSRHFYTNLCDSQAVYKALSNTNAWIITLIYALCLMLIVASVSIVSILPVSLYSAQQLGISRVSKFQLPESLGMK